MRTRYSEPVWRHFRAPHGGCGLSDSSALVGEADTPGSDAVVRLEIALDGNHHIERAAFRAYGCPACIAAASWLCAHVEGRTLAQARCLTVTEIERALELPADKRHCVLLALDALAAALEQV